MYLDILILIIFIFGILSGIRNGIFIEVISVFGFAINLLITKIYTPVVLRFLKRSDASFANNYVITYIVTFYNCIFSCFNDISFCKEGI